jgi:signal recognition particle receptor subunit alpha
MFDYFCIFTTSGVVLWYKAFVEMKFDLINQLIKDIMIEEKTAKNQYTFKGSIIKWKIANELNLIFTVVYKEVLHLSFVEELLDLIKIEFTKKVVPNLELENGLYQSLPTYFDKNFKQVQAKWEMKTQEMKGPKKMRTFDQSKKAKKGGTLTPSTKKDEPAPKLEKDPENVKLDESKMTKAELAQKHLAEKFNK